MILEEIKKCFNIQNSIPQELVRYVLIYLRKSRKDTEFSKEPLEKTLERHETILQNYAKSVFGTQIPEENIFREVVSGDTISDRPEMQKVLNLIEEDTFKAVLCLETERLARGNSIDQGVIVQKFHLTNTLIITPNKIYNLDNEMDLSYFEDGLYQARKYLTYTKKILSRGRYQSVEEGKYIGSTAPFGYSKKKIQGAKGWTLEKNDDNWKVRKLFDLFIYENLGTSRIAHKLNELGIKSSTSDVWTPAMVRNYLKRAELYAGYITFDKRKEVKKMINGEVVSKRPLNPNYLKVKGLHEPTITEEELQIINDKLKNIKSPSVKKNLTIKNPFAGLVTCGLCNRKMIRRPYNKSFLKNGKIHEDTLICVNINCNNTSSNLSIVEKRIIEEIKVKKNSINKMLSDYKISSQNNDELKKEIALYHKKIDSLIVQKNRAYDLLEQGIYTTDVFFERTNILNKEIENINANINEINLKIENNNKSHLETFYPQLDKLISLYDKLSSEDKNMLLKSIINNIEYTKTNKNGRFDKNAEMDFKIKIDWRF